MNNVELDSALARLDADLAKSEHQVTLARQRLADAESKRDDLLLKRKGAEALLAYMGQESTLSERHTPSRGSTGQGNIVEAILREKHGQVLTNIEIQEITTERGYELNAEQIRSALSYLRRKGVAVQAGRRGHWVLKDAETPEATGVSDNDRSYQRDRSLEEGGPHNGSPTPMDHGGDFPSDG